MKAIASGLALFLTVSFSPAAEPFDSHGLLRVAKSGTHLEHADGTPFFVLADTCWTGPALSTEKDWQTYLADRKRKGFTAVQFNMVSPWRTAPIDAEGNASYAVENGKLKVNEAFYKRLDARMKAIRDAGLLPMPVLIWAHKKGDAGFELSEEHIIELVKFEVARYSNGPVFWILAGDNRYASDEAVNWKRVGRAVFGDKPGTLVTTHPVGQHWPWKSWDDEKWLTVLGYQSGHGDSFQTMRWLHSGPAAEYGRQKEFTRPVMNLEPPYEGHNGYSSKKPHSDYSTRRSVYWSLLVHPPMGVTYGGHGVWSWHTKSGEEPTDHKGTGVAKIWSEALDLPGATQMGYMRKLFESVKWTELRPAQHLFPSQPGDKDPSKFVACAATPDHSTIVAYCPAGSVDRTTITLGSAGYWFNPRTGERDGRKPDKPSDGEDWVFVIKK
jgi:hypothetical protein